MTIIEISALANGAHRNQSFHGVLPDGWAMIPDGMAIPETFPFVDITVEGDVVISMTAGIVPEPKPEPMAEPTIEEILNAMLGVTDNE